MKWLNNLFKRPCEHSFSMWQIIKQMYSTDGCMIIVQTRVCSKCGFTEINKQYV